LPAGLWTHLLTGRLVEGPGWQRETHDYMSLPLMVRPNTLLALGSHDDRPDYNCADGVELWLFELADGARAAAAIPTLHGDVAARFEARRVKHSITVERSRPALAWKLVLVGVSAVETVEGAKAEEEPRGVMVIAEAETRQVTITLR
jgi:alpha-D-xyloside xylohydrolase